MSDQGEYSEEYLERRRRRPVLRELSSEEFAELFRDLDPPGDDEVSVRFPAKVEMERPADESSR